VARIAAAAVLALLLAAGVAGCSSDSASPVVVRVGRLEIDRATVDHWARAITLGSPVDAAFGKSATPRQKALDFLIAADWAIGSAAEHGRAPSADEVAHAVDEKVAGAPNGRKEFEKEIASTGQTLADVKLEAEASLAVAALRDSLAKSVPPVTEAQIANYYARHRRSFRVPDRRSVDLIEAIPSRAKAIALGKRLGAGKRFAKRALRELVPRETPSEAAHAENAELVRTIFATPPGRVGEPARFNRKWVLIVVRKVVPARQKPLNEVREEITERLEREHRRQVLARFLEAYRREWTAKTRCATGFVVQKCSGYRGPRVPEADPLAGG
jgi:hypothetical protein